MKANNIMYISHGGGPMPLLGDKSHQEMIDTLTMLANTIDKPSAILLISAHWEAKYPTITSGKLPELVYDYYGFPPASYEIQYPAPGEPELANRVKKALFEAGFDAHLDHQRGFDHGMFVPLKIMYPEADIPCVQLSLVQSMDANLHIEMGKALQHLDWQNLLVIGSGFSFHNMRAFFAPNHDENNRKNIEFHHWLVETMTNTALTEKARTQTLIRWDEAPYARFCHPREEHLLPLLVCYGLAGKPSNTSFNAQILKHQSSMFAWD